MILLLAVVVISALNIARIVAVDPGDVGGLALNVATLLLGAALLLLTRNDR